MPFSIDAISDPNLARQALSWTLAQDVTVALPPGDETLFSMAVDILSKCGTLTRRELANLQKLAAEMDPIFET